MKQNKHINYTAVFSLAAVIGIGLFLNSPDGRNLIGSKIQPIFSGATKGDTLGADHKLKVEPTGEMVRTASSGRKPPKNPPPAGTRYSTRFIYLVPSDRAISDTYTNSIKASALNLQNWFRNNTTPGSTTGKTLILNTTIVEVYKTNHTAAWYNGSGASADFWNNALADGFALTGGRFSDPYYRWIYYIDADSGPGQVIGGTSGVALMARNDLLGLSGSSTDGTPVTRWIGGAGHEIGHSMGLPHPPGCEQNASTTLCQTALMYLGYITYPNAILTDADRQTLNNLPFFQY